MSESVATIILIAANVIFSYLGMTNRGLFERFLFRVGPILDGKEWHRILTSGFLHGSWTHLLVNMITLYYFGRFLEGGEGTFFFLLVYFLSMIGGDLLALAMHKDEPRYSAVGASGAISGVLFATILMRPDITLYLMLFIPIPAVVFGIGYIIYSLFGIRSQSGNVGHEAHLGGAMLGMLVTLVLNPGIFIERWWLVILLFVPIALFFFMFWKRPDLLYNPRKILEEFKILRAKSSGKFRVVKEVHPDDSLEFELDRLLEKVATRGLKSLSREERKRLDELSQVVNYNKRNYAENEGGTGGNGGFNDKS